MRTEEVSQRRCALCGMSPWLSRPGGGFVAPHAACRPISPVAARARRRWLREGEAQVEARVEFKVSEDEAQVKGRLSAAVALSQPVSRFSLS